MKKAAVVLSTLVLFSTLAAGCTNTNETTARERETPDTDETVTTVTVNVTDVPNPVTDHVVSYNGVSEIRIDYEPADHGRIRPYIGVYIPDEWMPEMDQHFYGLIDMDGNVICDAVFDMAYYCKSTDSYIVRRTENGVAKYGILSANGAEFTGLIYDGLWDLEDNEVKGVSFYGSVFINGKLNVMSLDSKFNVVSEKEITIDEEALGLEAANAQLSVEYLNGNRAFILNRDNFYPNKYLIDTTTGEVLYKTSELDITDGEMFGKLIIEQDADAQGIRIIDLDGKVFFEDENVYSWKVCPDRYMIAFDYEVDIYDLDWKCIRSIPLDNKSIVYSSFGNIAVNSGFDTKLYDKDLNLIAEWDDMFLGDGTFFRDWYGYGDGDMYFDSISYSHEIYNINTGERLAKEGTFFYSFKYGYIFADNKSDGNDPVDRWLIYDGHFNLVSEGLGYAYLICDDSTGYVYTVVLEEGTMTVYNTADGTEMFSTDNTCYNFTVSNGRFYGWNKNKCFLLDTDGTVLFEQDVKHAV